MQRIYGKVTHTLWWMDKSHGLPVAFFWGVQSDCCQTVQKTKQKRLMQEVWVLNQFESSVLKQGAGNLMTAHM